MGDPYAAQELMCFYAARRCDDCGTSLSWNHTWTVESADAAARAGERSTRKRQSRACFRGLVRSTIILRRLAHRAAERTFAPGGIGFMHAAEEFHHLHAKLLCGAIRANMTRCAIDRK